MASSAANILDKLEKFNQKLERLHGKMEARTGDLESTRKEISRTLNGFAQEFNQLINSGMTIQSNQKARVEAEVARHHRYVEIYKPKARAPVSEPSDDMRQPLIDRSQEQQMDLDVKFTVYDSQHIVRHEEQTRELESNMYKISDMMKDLNNMVVKQGETLNDIESNTLNAKAKVEGGHEQLLQAEELMKKGRKKQCCLLFLVLIVLGVVVLVSQVTK